MLSRVLNRGNNPYSDFLILLYNFQTEFVFLMTTLPTTRYNLCWASKSVGFLAEKMTYNLTTDDNKIIKFATLARLQAQNAPQCSIYDNSPHDTRPFQPCACLTARKGTKPIRLPAIQRKGTYDSRK